jgi:hypothetical protein
MEMFRPIAAMVMAVGLIAPITAPVVVYASRGVVTVVSKTELVIARPKHRGDLTLTLAASTRVDGALKVGATISVRYHDEGGHHIANAIAVEPPSINGN